LSELVVEGDGCGEGEEALRKALSDAGEGAGVVALEGEDVPAGPEDAPMRWRIGARCGATLGLVFAAGPEDRGVQFADLRGEFFAGVALVTEPRVQCVPSCRPAPPPSEHKRRRRRWGRRMHGSSPAVGMVVGIRVGRRIVAG
jgi:hypothetical protein